MSFNRDGAARIPAAARWDDLEAFAAVAAGVRAGRTVQDVAEDPRSGVGSPRMLYFRLTRLEKALGQRLVDRRPWGRSAALTDAGQRVAEVLGELSVIRQRVRAATAEPEAPMFRLVTHATLVSAVLPPVIAHRTRVAGFNSAHLSIAVVGVYEGAVAAVNEARADLGLYLVLPSLPAAYVPRGVVKEMVARTDVVVLAHQRHGLARRRRRGRLMPVSLDELLDECMVTRGLVDQQLLPAGTRGRRIIVPHSLDKIAYVRLGVGLALLPRLAADLLQLPSEICVLSLRPRLFEELTVLRPRKMTRPVQAGARGFVESVRAIAGQWERGRRRGAKATYSR
ncbi:MAG: LysR family transcriptional regulator [Candidatus Andersenbacteria bacterium]|nr:LysR family transcriptional regulator [Candidatus Andersenbacteria bacterium]